MQIDVALNYVLPAIAAEVKKKGKALTERQILKVVENCWRILRSRYTQKAFPDRWIGRKKDIIGNSRNAEEWYDRIIHQLLWQQLGLLMRDSENQYRVFHQQVAQYLDATYWILAQQILKRQRKRGLRFTLLYVLFLLCIAALARWEEFESDLRRDLWYPCSKYYDHYEDVVQNNFTAAIEAVQMYVENPNNQTAKTAHTALRNSAIDILDSLEWWPFYSTSSERYNPETGTMEYTGIEKKILELNEKSVDSMVYLDKSYLEFHVSETDDSKIFSDYFAILFTLDTLLTYHQSNSDCLDLISNYVSCTNAFVEKRGMVSKSLFDYFYYYYDSTVTQSTLQEIDAQLTKLSEQLADIYQTLPRSVQLNNETRISLFLESGLWQDYSTDSFPLLPVPLGWEVPAWMPADADTFYLITDDTSEEIRIVRDESDIIPFAWCAVCPNVLKEDVLSYMEKVITQSGPYWYNNQEDYFQAIIQLESVSVNIVWTTEKTELIITGALY